MGMVNGIRALNALVSGTMSSAQLTTYLATGSNAGSFGQLLQLRGQSKALAASSTAMTAVAASSTAFAAVMANSTAWATVVASSTAMTAVVASSTAKMAIFNSDTALNSISASSTAMTAMRAAAQYSVVSWTENSNTPVTLTLTGTSHIVLGASRSTASAARTNTLTTLRSGSTISATTALTSTTASTTATDFNCAIPIVSTRSVVLSGTGNGTGYLGILRCDV